MKLYLMLHGLGSPPAHLSADEKRYWIDLDRFAAILDMVRRAEGRVELTFDDGNHTDAGIALPMLQKAGLRARFFVIAGSIGEPEHLSEADIRALQAAGMRIGSHGFRHLPWTAISDDAVREDIATAGKRLAEIVGAPIGEVAVPFGECDLRIVRLLRRARIGRVFTSFHGPTLNRDWLVRRECVTTDIPMATIEDWIFRRYGAYDVVYSTLRAARHVRHAVLWGA